MLIQQKKNRKNRWVGLCSKGEIEMKKVNQNRLIQTFQHLVEMDSPSLGERQVGQFLAEQLTALGLSVSEDDAGIQLGGNCGNLYCHWEGSDNGGKEAPLLFSAHLDTVEPSRGKKAVILPDGTIRSAGDTVLGADDFAGVAAILEAVRTIAEKKLPHREIELLFSGTVPIAHLLFLLLPQSLKENQRMPDLRQKLVQMPLQRQQKPLLPSGRGGLQSP